MREEILAGVRKALAERDRRPHPGPAPHEPGSEAGGGPVEQFATRFRGAGGEVLRFPDAAAAQAWTEVLASETGLETVVHSPLVPEALHVPLPEAAAPSADLGVSLALLAAADTGSLLLTSLEGRRMQLLPETHLVWVPVDRVRDRLQTALDEVREAGTAALALHSGPSKSADIGRIVVTGVHGPARVIAALIG